jgi:hypothetical protein
LTPPEDDLTSVAPNEAKGLMAILTLGLAILLLVLAPFVTRFQQADKAWFLAPIIGPVFALLVMAIPAAILSWNWWRNYRHAASPANYMVQSCWAFGDFTSAIEYGIYFCGYLWVIHHVGFAISTLVFGQACLYRSGLRSREWIVKNLIFTVVIVFVLRVLLGLWFPMAPLFKLLPSGIGNLLGTYL